MLCFNYTATTHIYTLSLHDALPIWSRPAGCGTAPGSRSGRRGGPRGRRCRSRPTRRPSRRSEEHTSELQSLRHLVCRLLLEKKKKTVRRREEQITKRTYINYKAPTG